MDILIQARNLLIRVIDPGLLTMVHGNLADAQARTNLPEPIGWPENAVGRRYAVRVGLDRMLAVGASLPGGWNGTFGATDVSDGLVTFELAGTGSSDILRRMGEIDLDLPSPSAAFILGQQRVILYRHEDGLRLHVTRPLAGAFANWLFACTEDLRK